MHNSKIIITFASQLKNKEYMSKVQTAIYMTVRVDVEYDESEMTKQDAIDTAVGNFDYDFKLSDDYGISVEDTEICGINMECYD